MPLKKIINSIPTLTFWQNCIIQYNFRLHYKRMELVLKKMVMIKEGFAFEEGWKKSLKKVLQDCHEEDRRLQYNGWVRLTFPNAFLYIKWLPPSNFIQQNHRHLVVVQPEFYPQPTRVALLPAKSSVSESGRQTGDTCETIKNTHRAEETRRLLLLAWTFFSSYIRIISQNQPFTHSLICSPTH